ncbi:MAG: methyltransferase domain-containing protein [Elusimicrobiota bacterium]
MDPKEHEVWNDAMARLYDPDSFITKTGFLIRCVERLRLRRTRRALASGPTRDTLDLGCGAGNLLELLQGGGRLVGVDLSETMLAQARLRLIGRPEVEFVKASAETLPFSDGIFGRVVCSEVLEHVLDPVKVIVEIRRVCRPGARVVFTVPNEGLINATKRGVIALGLKRAIAGEYPMSDDMLDAWHLSEISEAWLIGACAGRFTPAGRWGVPSALLPYHRILAFDAA